jgi:hypothetical protein
MKTAEGVIKNEATSLAKMHNIADVGRVISIMKKTAMDADGKRLDKKRNSKKPLRFRLKFAPSLKEALVFLSPDKAMDLFEGVDPDKLQLKVLLLKYMFSGMVPFYTLYELGGLIKKFIKYLNDNKSSLVSIGYPAKSFENDRWLYNKLSRLYPVKAPDSIQSRDYRDQKAAEANNTVERDAEGNLIFNYTWLKEKIDDILSFESQKHCTYDEAFLVPGVTAKDAERIEEERARLFNLKIEILNIAHRYITGEENFDNFWDECIDAISDKVFRQDFPLFKNIERKTNLFLRPVVKKGCIRIIGDIVSFHENIELGGIKNLLEFINFVEKELKIGKVNNIKHILMLLLYEQKGESYIPKSYYELVLFKRDIDCIDALLSCWSNYNGKEGKVDETFKERRRKDVKKRFKSPLRVNPEKYDEIKAVADFIEENYKLGRNVVIRYAVSIKNKVVYSVELPSGTEWKDITIKFLDGNNVNIKVEAKDSNAKDFNHNANYKEMGFEKFDKKGQTLVTDHRWKFLEHLCQHNRKLPKGYSVDGKKFDKTQKYLLSKALKEYFLIKEDPFFPPRRTNVYEIKIKFIPY